MASAGQKLKFKKIAVLGNDDDTASLVMALKDQKLADEVVVAVPGEAGFADAVNGASLVINDFDANRSDWCVSGKRGTIFTATRRGSIPDVPKGTHFVEVDLLNLGRHDAIQWPKGPRRFRNHKATITADEDTSRTAMRKITTLWNRVCGQVEVRAPSYVQPDRFRRSPRVAFDTRSVRGDALVDRPRPAFVPL